MCVCVCVYVCVCGGGGGNIGVFTFAGKFPCMVSVLCLVSEYFTIQVALSELNRLPHCFLLCSNDYYFLYLYRYVAISGEHT